METNTTNTTVNNTGVQNASTSTATTTKTSKFSWGAIATIIAGALFIYLLAMGSWTDNRFGTHLVLSSDLSSAGEQGWFLYFVLVVGLLTIVAGIVALVLDILGIIDLDEQKDNSLKIGATLLIGSAAFILALSSISFAAFNWQFFDSEIANGTSSQAWAWIILTIVATIVTIGFTITGLTGVVNLDRKLFVTLRNSSIAFVALGWFVFNLCINSFGAMGGDAEVLINGLTDGNVSLAALGEKLEAAEIDLAPIAAMDARTFYEEVLQTHISALSKVPWIAASVIVEPLWNNTLQPLFQHFADNPGALAVILKGFEKEGMIMGVNNSANSMLIFISLLGLGVVGIPVYGVLTHGNEEKRSVLMWGSIYTIAAITGLYLFLTLTPYMAPVEEYSLIEQLFKGEYGGFCPGLIAQAGQAGGIHTAIVYFSGQYNGTAMWWIAEVLTFLIPVGAFTGAYFTSKNK